MKKGSCTIPPARATRWSFIVFGISALVFGTAFVLLWGFAQAKDAVVEFLTNYVWLAVTLPGGMLLHEVIHAVFFGTFSRNGFRSVSFGINWQHLAPYVNCSEALTVRQYAIATIMPGIALGLIPSLYAVVSGAGWFLVFGIFFTAGSAGDFLSFTDLLTLPQSASVTDHPDEAGFTWTDEG